MGRLVLGLVVLLVVPVRQVSAVAALAVPPAQVVAVKDAHHGAYRPQVRPV